MARRTTIINSGRYDPVARRNSTTEAKDQWADTSGVRRIRETPVRVATLGDSQANTNSPVYVSNATTDAKTTDVTTARSAVWNSGTITLRQYGRKWAVQWFYPQAYLVANGGISGETTTALLARDAAAAGVTRQAITDVLALNPDVVLIQGGCSINDFANVTTSGQVTTAVATALANITEALTRLLSSAVPVILTGIYGYSGDGVMYAGTGSLIRSALLQHNANLRAIAAANPAMVKYVDPVGAVSDADGNLIAGTYININPTDVGVHLNAVGQYLMAPRTAAALKALFGASANVRYRGANRFLDPLFQQASPAYGGLAASAGPGASVANSKLETIDTPLGPRRFFTTEVTITNAANGYGTITIPYNPLSTGTNPLNIASGDIYGFECDVYLAPLYGTLPSITTETFRVGTNNTAGSGIVYLDVGAVDGSNYGYTLTEAMTRHIVWPPLLYGDSAAHFTSSSAWIVRVQSATVGDKFKIGVAIPHIDEIDQGVKTTAANLVTAAAAELGHRAVVTDSTVAFTSANVGAVVAGGGSHTVPVICVTTGSGSTYAWVIG